MSLDEFCTGRSSGHLRLSRYVVSAMGQRAREEARIAPRVTFVNARRCVRVRIYTGIPTAADCSRVTRPCPGVTRDSLDFSHSLRGLSCLLQKHRLRYTIKSPAQFRGLAPLSSLFLSLLSSRAFLSLSPSPRSLTLRLFLSVPIGGFTLCPVIILLVVVVMLSYRATLRDITEENAEATSSWPLTIRARLIFLLYPLLYSRAAPFPFLRRGCAALPL